MVVNVKLFLRVLFVLNSVVILLRRLVVFVTFPTDSTLDPRLRVNVAIPADIET